MRVLREIFRPKLGIALLVLLLSAAFSTQAAAISILVPLTGGQAEPEPTFTGAFGTALFEFTPETGEITVNVQVFGIDVVDLFDIPTQGPLPGPGPFHLHIESPDPPTDQTGPIAVDFGTASDWVQVLNGITLNATGVRVAGVSAEDLATALFRGTTYLNLHTLDFRSGEIRGDIPALEAIPEPTAALLIGVGLLGLGVTKRRFRV